MKRALLVLGIAIVTAFVFFGTQRVLAPIRESYPDSVVVAEKTYVLEIAATKEEQTLGLGGRDSLCDTCAMLFLFREPARHGFWMKDMRFPLDIVWLLGERVVHIEHHVPYDSMAVYYPESEANQVLEFNAGALEGVRVGDSMRFSFE